jgi:hypothetical protein
MILRDSSTFSQPMNSRPSLRISSLSASSIEIPRGKKECRWFNNPRADHDRHEPSRMSVPARDYDPRRIFLISCPNLPFFKHKRAIGTYVAGALVCIFPVSPQIFLLLLFLFRVLSIELIIFQLVTSSSPSPTQSFSMRAHFPHTQSHLRTLRTILYQSMYLFLTGYLVSVPLLVFSSSTSSTRNVYYPKELLVVNQASSGVQDCSSSSGLPSWLEAWREASFVLFLLFYYVDWLT